MRANEIYQKSRKEKFILKKEFNNITNDKIKF